MGPKNKKINELLSIMVFIFPGLNGRTCWTTLISVFCTLVESEDDRLYVVYNGGLQMTFEVSFYTYIIE